MDNNSSNIVRILNIVPNMRAAGIETFIMNVYRNIDRNKIQFDFLVHSNKKEFYDDEIEKLGGRIYRLSLKDDKNIFKYIKDLNLFFKNHKEYKIVHGHMQSMMPIYLYIAKKHNLPVRIAHSHNNDYEKTIKGFLLHIISRFSKKYSTINFACSRLAGEYLFKNDYRVIYNGIDVNKFKFDKDVRNEQRKKLGLENKFVIGFIGRLEKQKNPLFALEIFREIKEMNKNSIFLMFGTGSLEKKVKVYIKNNNLEENVLLMGVRDNIQEYISTFDAFLCPSLYEGLGIVLVENQYMRVKVYTTSGTVAEETCISDLINYIPLSYSSKQWAKKIVENNKESCNFFINNNNFDIKNVSYELQKKYLEYYKESR